MSRTDASGYGLAAVLLQEQNGILLPVSYASKKLLTRKQRYGVIERECLAIVWAIDNFKNYLFGCPFVLQTDHKALKYLALFSCDCSWRFSRWSNLKSGCVS